MVRPSFEEANKNALDFAEQEHQKVVDQMNSRQVRIKETLNEIKEVNRIRYLEEQEELQKSKQSTIDSILRTQDNFVNSWDRRIKDDVKISLRKEKLNNLPNNRVIRHQEDDMSEEISEIEKIDMENENAFEYNEAMPESHLKKFSTVNEADIEQARDGWTRVSDNRNEMYNSNNRENPVNRRESVGLNTGFVDINENDVSVPTSHNSENRANINSTVARKKLLNLSNLENTQNIENIVNTEDKRILDEPITPKQEQNLLKLEKQKNKKIDLINSWIDEEYSKLTTKIKKGVEDNKPIDRLRVYSINRITSLKTRQNVQLKKATMAKKQQVKSTNQIKQEDLFTEEKPKRSGKKLQYEELTANKSRLTVSTKTKTKTKMSSKKLDNIQEKHDEKAVMNESINK